jgi:precorrin-6B methylase 2
MERGTDWARLWSDLVRVQTPEREKDLWKEKSNRRWAKPDSSRDFIIAQLEAAPGSTLLDIGAGTGKWAILLSQYVGRVTAIDPSPTMLQAMQENLQSEGVTNVQVIEGAWPDVTVEPHDFSLCSHAMYGSADLPAFIRRMVQVTRRLCFLVLRAPATDGIMAEAAMRVWGHPYDSPNFQVAYNVLLQMGIYANVLMESGGLWTPWKNASIEEALGEVKRRLGLGPSGEHDEFLTDLLRRRLIHQDGQYVWPPSVRSALIYWGVNQ